METRKTPAAKRSALTYSYQEWDENRKCYVTAVCTIEKNTKTGVTDEMICTVHRMRDREVENNLKHAHRPLSAQEKEEKKEWEADHPGEKYPMPWNISLDSRSWDEEGIDCSSDKSYLQALAALPSFTKEENETAETERLHYLMDHVMSEKQRNVLSMLMYDGQSLQQIAQMLNCSHENVRTHLKKAIQCILDDWEAFVPYYPAAKRAQTRHLNLRSLAHLIQS